VGSLETQVLTQARRFEDLKVDHEGRNIEPLAALDTAVRPLAKLSDETGPKVRLVKGEES
jgi:DNA recombination protein RmuC